MGTYCTTTSIQVLMVGTKFDTATTALCTELITQSESEINKYLSKRYDLASDYFQTSTATPPIVQTWAKNLTQGYMYNSMARGGKEAFIRGNGFIKRVMDNLKDVADYKMDITDSTGAVISDMSNTAYKVLDNSSDYSQTFNEDSPLKWRVDIDKLQDIKDDRDL